MATPSQTVNCNSKKPHRNQPRSPGYALFRGPVTPWTNDLHPQHLTISLPSGGIGYGLLRYFKKEKALEDWPKPEVDFNNLVTSAAIGGSPTGSCTQEDWTFEWVERFDDVPDHLAKNRLKLHQKLGQKVTAHDGRLKIRFAYSRERFRRSTIERITQHYIETVQTFLGLLCPASSIFPC